MRNNMRNIFLFVSCMVVFLSIIGCSIELKEEEAKEKKCKGYKVDRNDNDPGLALVKNRLAEEGVKSPDEMMKVVNDAFAKTTTVHVAVALYLARSKLKEAKGNAAGAKGDKDEANELTQCLVDNDSALHQYTVDPK